MRPSRSQSRLSFKGIAFGAIPLMFGRTDSYGSNIVSLVILQKNIGCLIRPLRRKAIAQPFKGL